MQIALQNTFSNTDSGSANGSHRWVITPLFGGTSIKFTMQGVNWVTSHVSVAKQDVAQNALATPVEVKTGGLSGFNCTSEITTDETPFTWEAGEPLIVTVDTISGNPRNRLSGGWGEWFSPSNASWNQAAPGGSWSANPSNSGGVAAVYATQPAPMVWVGGRYRSAKMYNGDAEGEYVFEKPDGSALDTTGDATGGINALLAWGRDYNKPVEIDVSPAFPYPLTAPITAGPYRSHHVTIRGLVLRPTAPLTFDAFTLKGCDRATKIDWSTGGIQVHIPAGSQNVGFALRPSGFRETYIDGSLDGSPRYPFDVILPTIESVALPGYAAPAGEQLVLFDFKMGGAFYSWIKFANIDCASMIKRAIKVNAPTVKGNPLSGFAYCGIDHGRISNYTSEGIRISAPTAPANLPIGGNFWHGTYESAFNVPAVRSSASFDQFKHSQVTCLNYGGAPTPYAYVFDGTALGNIIYPVQLENCSVLATGPSGSYRSL